MSVGGMRDALDTLAGRQRSCPQGVSQLYPRQTATNATLPQNAWCARPRADEIINLPISILSHNEALVARMLFAVVAVLLRIAKGRLSRCGTQWITMLEVPYHYFALGLLLVRTATLCIES